MTRFRIALHLLPMLLLSAGALHASSPSFSEPFRYFDFQPCSGSIYIGPGATGGVGCAAGKFRNGAVFDGIDDAVIAPGSAGEPGYSSFTLAAWVKPATGATLPIRTIAGKEGSFKLELVGGTTYRFSVTLTNGAVASISQPVPSSGWTHVAGVYEGEAMAIFVSGQGEYRPVNPTIAATPEPFVIGNNPSFTPFAGSLDEVKLWKNEALDKRQLHELASMLPRPDSGAPGSTADADLALVAKSPRIPYDTNPNVPAPGSNVTWEAHVRNRGSVALVNLRVQWYLDGTYLGATNIASIAPGAQTTTTWTLPWSSADQYLAVWADPQNVVLEVSERNNYRLVRTNSLMVGFWVEQSTRNYFDAYQLDFLRTWGLMADEANSFEDWAQRQIDRYNWALSNPAIPVSSGRSGLDRVRLDQIVVVPDGSLPLAGGRPTNHPDKSDKTVDMMWGFPAPVDTAHYDRNRANSAFYTEQGLVHELNHARFLVDTYALNLHRQMVGVENGVGYRIYPNAPGGLPVYRTSAAGGMMEGQSFRYAEWEIDWLNLYAGLRPLPGWANYNAHYGLYDYLHLLPALPAQNRLKILDASGQPLHGAKVYMYQSVPQELPAETYPRFVDNVPELVATVPANGEIAIGQNPFSVADIWGYNFEYCVNFLRIVYNGQEFYSGIDLANLQVEYFRNHQSLAIHPIVTPFAQGSSNPNDLRVEGGIAPLTFIDQCVDSLSWRKEWRVRNDGSGWANLLSEDVEYGGCGGSPVNGLYPMRLFEPATLPGRIIQCAPSGQMRHVYELSSPTLAPYLESYHDPVCP